MIFYCIVKIDLLLVTIYKYLHFLSEYNLVMLNAPNLAEQLQILV